jgi:tetratricopeptide (TPR) repeat protein
VALPVASFLVLSTLLSPVARADPSLETVREEACVENSALNRLEEFRPAAGLTLSDSSDTSYISVLELSMQIPRKARKAHQEAIKAFRDSRIADGQRLLIEALTLEPRYFQASTLLAALLFNSKDYSAARIFAERARSINPHYLPALEILGALDVLAGKYSEGVAKLTEVLRFSPRRQAAHHYLGIALLHQGQCADASRHLQAAANVRANPPKQRPLKEQPLAAEPPELAWHPRGHH